jgi:hypothetical protein
MTPEEIDRLFGELIEAQRKKTLELAQRINPRLSADDLFQPHDHPSLASHPVFQFEDGILAGLLSARAALLARRREG